ncbi:MAG: carbon starvation protein A [Planctomycetota bacterium]
MSVLIIALIAIVVLTTAYFTYGRWLARVVFRLDAKTSTPAERLRDDSDYLPTPKGIVFGHHFTSIAGTGPIVGPAIAVMWGWLPALLWVLFGSVLVGAVHDFGSLVVSLRHDGRSVGDVAGSVLNRRVRVLFLLVLFLALTVVLAIFGLVIAAVFRQYPASIFPCLIQIPIAIGIGVWLHRKSVNLLVPSLIALATMYATVIFGDVGFLGSINASMASWPTIVWVAILLIYSYVASVLPVWILLQPRDYINSLQLISSLGLVVLGLAAAAFVGGVTLDGGRASLDIVAPMVRWNPPGAPAIVPFLFVTIACGACSGFHCLVSSGTSSKQIEKETDAQMVGYGSMLLEGFLATIVILACVAGLGLGVETAEGEIVTGKDAYLARYADWAGAAGLGAKVGAFVDGSAGFLRSLGIGGSAAVAIMGVLVASFAATTLDTACRLQRYVIQELALALSSPTRDESSNSDLSSGSLFNPLVWLQGKHASTLFAITLATIIAALPAPGTTERISDAMTTGGMAGAWQWLSTYGGKGGLILWPLFGATNQLLAGLAFLVIAFFLLRRGLAVWFLIPPMLMMLVVPAWAMLSDLPKWFKADDPNYVAIVVGGATIVLEAWMMVEAWRIWQGLTAGSAKTKDAISE